MNPVTASSQQNSSDPSGQSTQNPAQPNDTGFFSGSWDTRDVAMFTTQGVSALGALVNGILGGWNTASSTTAPANISNSQPSSLTTGNSYVLLGFGVIFGISTLIQIGSHYHWRKDTQNAKNTNFTSLGDQLAKDVQEFQVVVEKIEAVRKQIGGVNPPHVQGTQIPPIQQNKGLTDHKTTPQIDAPNNPPATISVSEG